VLHRLPPSHHRAAASTGRQGLRAGLKANGQKKGGHPHGVHHGSGDPEGIQKDARLEAAAAHRRGAQSYICPLMYMNNPLCGKQPVITCSNKLRTYTTARYYSSGDILEMITGGAK
jgi:hypothetical protein